LSNYIVALQEPKVNEIRSEAIALGAMVFSRPHDTYRRALSALQHDTPVLGWGVGDEMEITKPATVYGHFITATNWCHNLPLLSTEKIGETLPADRLRQPRQNGIWDLAWESDVHYAAFIMSDGDNVQWLMGDFVEDAWHCYWSNANRGKVPIGWTNCYMELAQLCPYAIEHLFKTATPNDDFVLFGGGYYYPDLFGSETGEQRLLRSHARRVGQYMQLANMRLFAVNCADWDSDAALGAYETFAQEIPTLDAIFAIQYAPYTAGEGAIKWVKTKEFEDVPVISARYSIWANVKSARDASPTVIAAKLNGMPHNGGPDTEDRFSWVVAHAWSWFKEPKQGEAPGAEEIDQAQGGQPGTGRGLNAVKWCVDALQPHVRVVTPGVLANLIQLRLHPQDTLTDELQGLERRLAKLREAQQKPAEDHMAQADELLKNAFKSLQKTLYQESFELGKQVYQILTQAG
jgi:hypothetical protein